ncbi:hypothetical protein AB0I16_16610 [Streptomyces sp. NPDC050703]|uniref:hypothetical protein n=1 Tax=Streptomyces sp. NPDC050703 TaxID=3157218 RepID=UPI00342172B4
MSPRAEPKPPTHADAVAATESLRDALGGAGIVLPSLAPDHASPSYGLVALGNVRAHVAQRLAAVIRRGGERA